MHWLMTSTCLVCKEHFCVALGDIGDTIELNESINYNRIKMCEAILSCCYTQDKTSRQQYVVVHVLSRGGACKRTGWSSKDMTWTSCMHLHSDWYTHGRCGARITNLIPSMYLYTLNTHRHCHQIAPHIRGTTHLIHFIYRRTVVLQQRPH